MEGDAQSVRQSECVCVGVTGMSVCQAFPIVISLNLAFLSICLRFVCRCLLHTDNQTFVVAHTPCCPLVSWLAASLTVPAAAASAAGAVVIVVLVWPARL